VAHAGLRGMCCDHAMTGIVEQKTFQEMVG